MSDVSKDHTRDRNGNELRRGDRVQDVRGRAYQVEAIEQRQGADYLRTHVPGWVLPAREVERIG